MGTRAGVGYSENPDSDVAGAEAARAALERAGVTRCDLVLLFAAAKHDAARILRSVRAIVGPEATIIGGGAVGAITNDRLGYEGCQVGIAVIASDSMAARTFLQPGLASTSELEVGRALGAQIRAAGVEREAPMLLMYESVKRSTPEGPMLNMGAPLLEGMQEVLGTWPPVVGLGMHGDLRWRPGLQYFGDRLESQSALAVTFSGNVKMSPVVINNLRPMST
ncbi:hypothetical protein BH11MYX4_BH11MYX4_01630 [soil metagenome]